MAGLPVVTTAISETTVQLAAQGLVVSFRPGEPESLAGALDELIGGREAARDRAARAREWLEIGHASSAKDPSAKIPVSQT